MIKVTFVNPNKMPNPKDESKCKQRKVFGLNTYFNQRNKIKRKKHEFNTGN